MEQFARAAQALSDETRLRILNLLMVKECCVCEVMQALDISQTRASRNLKILDDAGFLRMRTEGLFTLYALGSSPGDGFHTDLVKAVGAALKANPEAVKDVKRLKQSKRVGPGCKPAACSC